MFSTQGLTGGPHTITATYTGDANFTGQPTPQQSGHGDGEPGGEFDEPLLSLSPGVRQGTTVTLQATLNGGTAGPDAPRGMVTFFVTGAETLSDSVNVTGLIVQDSFNLSAGDYQITASYSGDTSYKPSQTCAAPPLAQRVNLASVQNPTVNVSDSVSGNQAPLGTAVTFTATVTGVTLTPTGTVEFFDENGNVLGNNPATLNAMGNAMAIATSGPVNTLAGGSHTIKAVYNPVPIRTTRATTTPSGTRSSRWTCRASRLPAPAPPTWGSVMFTATVTPPTPSGVSFMPMERWTSTTAPARSAPAP